MSTQVRYFEQHVVEVEVSRNVQINPDERLLRFGLSDAVSLYYKLRDELRRVQAIEE